MRKRRESFTHYVGMVSERSLVRVLIELNRRGVPYQVAGLFGSGTVLLRVKRRVAEERLKGVRAKPKSGDGPWNRLAPLDRGDADGYRLVPDRGGEMWDFMNGTSFEAFRKEDS